MTETLSTFKALADPTRLRILRSLAAGPFHVNELVAILGTGQSTVSRHLRLLAEAGLVECRRTKTWAYYSLAKNGKDFPARQLGALETAWADQPNPDRAAVESALARRRDATRAFFRRRATDWDRLRDDLLGPLTHVDRLAELVGDAPVVVDLGTGTGVLLERLAPRAGRLIGIDASPEMLEVARRRAHDAHLANTELRLGALEHLPLSDGEANAMVANLVLHHVADVSPVLREVRRGLARGGRLVLVELAASDDEELWRALGAPRPGFRTEELRAQLEREGFRVLRSEPVAPEATNGRPAAADFAARGGSTAPRRPAAFLLEASRID